MTEIVKCTPTPSPPPPPPPPTPQKKRECCGLHPAWWILISILVVAGLGTGLFFLIRPYVRDDTPAAPSTPPSPKTAAPSTPPATPSPESATPSTPPRLKPVAPQNPPSPKKIQPPGLQKLENASYMTSVLQCLFALPKLREFVPQKEDKAHVAEQLQVLFKEMKENKKSPVDPKIFVQKIQKEHPRDFPSGQQRDAHDFLKKLLDDAPSLQSSFAVTVTTKREHLPDILKPRFKIKDEAKVMTSLSVPLGEKNTLLGQFLSMTTVPHVDFFFIPANNAKAWVSYQNSYKLGQYLQIKLERFGEDAGKTKKSSSVEVEEELSFEFCPGFESKASYNLRSVVLHTGDTANSGHYKTLVKHEKTWYLIDDGIVTNKGDDFKTAAAGESVSTDAYLLLYEQSE